MCNLKSILKLVHAAIYRTCPKKKKDYHVPSWFLQKLSQPEFFAFSEFPIIYVIMAAQNHYILWYIIELITYVAISLLHFPSHLGYFSDDLLMHN